MYIYIYIFGCAYCQTMHNTIKVKAVVYHYLMRFILIMDIEIGSDKFVGSLFCW